MKKQHFYYKISDDGIVATHLQGFMNECAEAEEKAREWAERQGASHYIESPDGMAGGVVAVEFDNTIAKDGWDKVTTPDGTTYFMPMADTDLEKDMYALPIASEAKLIGILALKPRKNKMGLPLPFTFGNTTPVIFKHHEYWYVDIPYESTDASFMPITEKEFLRRRMAAVNERK